MPEVVESPPNKTRPLKRGVFFPGQTVFWQTCQVQLKELLHWNHGMSRNQWGHSVHLVRKMHFLAHNTPACIKGQQQRCWCRKPWQIKSPNPKELSSLQRVQAWRVQCTGSLLAINICGKTVEDGGCLNQLKTQRSQENRWIWTPETEHPIFVWWDLQWTKSWKRDLFDDFFHVSAQRWQQISLYKKPSTLHFCCRFVGPFGRHGGRGGMWEILLVWEVLESRGCITERYFASVCTWIFSYCRWQPEIRRNITSWHLRNVPFFIGFSYTDSANRWFSSGFLDHQSAISSHP